MQGPCEHCGNPLKEFWETQCMYKGGWPTHQAFALTGFNPPCALEASVEEEQDNSWIWFAMAIVLMVAAICFWAFL